ncbi:MAG: ATP-dependent DNA helicase RecG [Pseudomonadota bacterium]
MARPEILFPLFASVEGLPGVGPKTAGLFARLRIERLRDLLFHVPERLVDRRPRVGLAGLEPKDVATVTVQIEDHRPGRTRHQPYRVFGEASDGTLEIVHFKTNAEWMRRLYPLGEARLVSGRVELWDGRWQMPHPDHVLEPAKADTLPPFEPVYALTEGLTGRLVGRAVLAALDRLDGMEALPEWIEPGLLAERGWPAIAAALRAMHLPDAASALAFDAPARSRLAYDELLSHQLALQLARSRMRRGKGLASSGDGRLRAIAAATFGYPPTGAQSRALDEITADMAEPVRMMRLLQGDVGSGKTWVAAMALLTAVEAGGQGVMMAPTEILARQHAASLGPIAEAAGVELVVLTGRDKVAERRETRAALVAGQAKIAVGTHALLQPDVVFQDLRLVVVDEQHRFGVRQRLELTEKAPTGADVLVMTATPIPRTLALAGYGDLDISVLDEKPPGRQPVETALVSQDRYPEIVERLKAAVARGSRAYWVCPAVEEDEDTPFISVEERHRKLAATLGPERVGLVHGQMPDEQKDAAVAAFQAGTVQVLVATTVIEVGVDVPEATIMVVEQADIFGLAQLHQLRGRVGRGAGRSSCLLMFPPEITETARARLAVLRETEDGFRIAEEDLRLRGAGDLLGHAQSGLPRFQVADLENDAALMARARDDARLVLHIDPELSTPRGTALRSLLYLMERDQSVRLLKSG